MQHVQPPFASFVNTSSAHFIASESIDCFMFFAAVVLDIRPASEKRYLEAASEDGQVMEDYVRGFERERFGPY